MSNLYNKGSILFNLQKFRDKSGLDSETPSYNKGSINYNLQKYRERSLETTESGVKNKRSGLDRVFDALSVGQYTTMGALKGVVDEDTTVLGGMAGGLKAANPFGDGYDKGEHSFSDVLEESGWTPDSTAGKIFKGTVGLAGDIFLDPLTYLSGGALGVVKGSGKLGKIAKKADALADIAKTSGLVGDFKSVDDVGKALIKKNYEELRKTGVTAQEAITVARSKTDEVLSESKKVLDNIDNGMDMERALEIVNRSEKYDDPAEAEEFAKKLMNKYNSLHGNQYSDKGWNLSLANAPFGNKLFGKAAEKSITLVPADKMMAFGDATLAPVFHKVRDQIYKGKIGSLFNTKSALYKVSRSQPDELYNFIKYVTVKSGLARDIVKSRKELLKFAEEHGLKDLTPADMKEIGDLLEDKGRLKTFRNYSKLIETTEGKESLEIAFKRRAELKNKFDAVQFKKDMYKETVDAIGLKEADTIEELAALKEGIMRQIDELDMEELVKSSNYSVEKIAKLTYDMSFGDLVKSIDAPIVVKDTDLISDGIDKMILESRKAVEDTVETIKKTPNEIIDDIWSESALFDKSKLSLDDFKQTSNKRKADIIKEFSEKGFLEYKNKSAAKKMADKLGFDVVEETLENGKNFKVQPKATELTTSSVSMKGNPYLMSKADMSNAINKKFFGVDGVIHETTGAKELDEVLDLIKRGKEDWEIRAHIEKHINRYNGKGALIDPYVKKAIGSFGGFDVWDNYEKTIQKVAKLSSNQRDKVVKELEKDAVGHFRRKFGLTEILNTPSGEKTINKLLESGKVDFKTKQAAQTLADKIGTKMEVIDEVVDGKSVRVYRTLSPVTDKHSFVQGLVEDYSGALNTGRVKTTIASYYSTGKGQSLNPNMSLEEVEKLLGNADYEALLKEYTLKKFKRDGLRSKLYALDYDQIQHAMSDMKNKEFEITYHDSVKANNDWASWTEDQYRDGTLKNASDEAYALPEEKTFNGKKQQEQHESEVALEKRKDYEMKETIKRHRINTSPALTKERKEIVMSFQKSREQEIGFLKFNLLKKVNSEMFDSLEGYEKFRQYIMEIGEKKAKNPLKDVIYDKATGVKATYEGDKKVYSDIVNKLDLNYKNFYKSNKEIEDISYSILYKKNSKKIDDDFEYVKNELRNSGRKYTDTPEETFDYLRELDNVDMPSDVQLKTITKEEYVKGHAVIDSTKPIEVPINSEAIQRNTDTLKKTPRVKLESDIMEGVIAENYTVLKNLAPDAKKAFAVDKQAKIKSLMDELEHIETSYQGKMELLERQKDNNLKTVKQIETVEGFAESQIKVYDDILATDEAKAEYIRRRIGDKEFGRLVEEYEVVRWVVDDSIPMDERLRSVAKALNDSLYQMGIEEKRISKLNGILDAYLPHILTAEGKELFEAISKDDEIIKKLPGFGDAMGYGRKWNPHSMSRTMTGNISSLNEVLSKEFPDILKGKNAFTDNLSTIFLTRAKKHTELMYDNQYMNNMFGMFGKQINTLADVNPYDKNFKQVMNYGVFKDRVSKQVDVMVKEALKDSTKKGKTMAPSEIKSFREEKTMELVEMLGFPKETLFDLATPMIELTPKQIETVLTSGKGYADDIIYNVGTSIVDDANRMRKSQIMKDNNDFLKMYDRFTHFIKLNQTTVMPGFHFRNKYGNMFNNWLEVGKDAYNPDYHKKTWQLMKKGSAEGGIKIKNTDGTVSEMSWNDIYAKAEEYGVIDEGFYEKDLGVGANTKGLLSDVLPGKFDPTNTKEFGLYAWGAKMGTKVEGTDRLIHFASQLGRGMSPEEAVDSMYKALFDYSDLTGFERDVMKRIFPYYTWMRKNAPRQIEMMLDRPEKYRLVSKVVNGISDMNNQDERVEDRYLAEFAKDFAQTPFKARNEFGEAEPILWNPSLPYGDINRIPDPMNAGSSIRELASQMNPMLKVPVEQALNKNFFFNSDLVKEGDNQVLTRLKHAVGQFPAVNAVTTAFQKEDADFLLHMLNQGSGVKFSAYNYEAFKRQQIRNKLGIDAPEK